MRGEPGRATRRTDAGRLSGNASSPPVPVAGAVAMGQEADPDALLFALAEPVMERERPTCWRVRRAPPAAP